MRSKIFLLAISIFGVVIAKATITDPKDDNGKKDDLNGTVIYVESKKPIKDVSITAYLLSKKEKTVLTNEDGNFAFDELKPGTYKFIFEKAGFKRITKDKVVIKADEAFQLKIEMIENSDFDIMPSPLHFSDMK